MDNTLSTKQKTINLSVYGASHALVDAICAGIVFSILRNKVLDSADFAISLVLYNLIAFGFQFLIGFVVDYFRAPQKAVSIGFVLSAIALILFPYFPVPGILLAATGNAFFHIGAGSICLNLTTNKATAPGIFVAPGAIGLFIGILLGKSGHFIIWPFLIALGLLFTASVIIKNPVVIYECKNIEEKDANVFILFIFFILLTIAIRSLIGTVLVFPWKTGMMYPIIFTLAVVSGKGLGGIIADKIGWMKVAVGALILSTPLLIFCTNIPYLAIIGVFLFNITMPVTLVALSNILSGRPGFAFGLTCLALFVGLSIDFLGLKFLFEGKIILLTTLICSILCLFLGLKYMSKIALLSKMK